MAFSLLLSSPPPSRFFFQSAPSSTSLSYAPCRISVRLSFRSRRRSSVRSTITSSAAGSSLEQDKNEKRTGPDLPTLWRRFYKVAAPYWFSDDKNQARLRLASVFVLTLGTTGISVLFNFLGRDFYNALANKDQEQFTKQLLYYLAGFAGGIPVFVLRDYARETLSLRWRSWMTSYYMDRYLKDRTFYKIQSQSIIDNPDQRIVDDLSSFTGTALAFSLTLFNAAVDLISFSNILYGIYPPLFVVLLVYSLGGTALSVILGKDLVTLNFMQEKKEADFRYGLVRVRENAESIAFYGGEGNELQLLVERFQRAFENLAKLLIASRNLEFFTNGYRYLIQILPAAVVAPMYFSGKIEFGVINQSVSAFNHILSDFSLIVYQFQAISAFSAVIERLGEFDDILDGHNFVDNSKLNDAKGIMIICCSKPNQACLQSNGSIAVDISQRLLEIQNLTLETPRKSDILIKDLSLAINDQDHLLVMGPSGSGKTSLLRALAGLWTTGSGNVIFYGEDSAQSHQLVSSEALSHDPTTTSETNDTNETVKLKNTRSEDIFFLPQRPYMVLGTLRQQLLYPTWTDDSFSEASSSRDLPYLPQVPTFKHQKPSDDDLIRMLELVHLGGILPRFNGLDSIHEWSSVLSLGEQQRLAFARLLLAKPKLVLLDESTSALDEANEAHLYRLIASVGITYVSVGHRRTLYNYHNQVLRISNFDPSKSNERNWHLESIDKVTADEPKKLSPSS